MTQTEMLARIKELGRRRRELTQYVDDVSTIEYRKVIEELDNLYNEFFSNAISEGRVLPRK